MLPLIYMLKETWNTFPRQIVQKINGLLEQAQPNSLKAFHIYKMCKAENLWSKSYSEFSFLLEGFYHTHPAERSKSQVDQFLDRPIDWRSYESLNLTFRTADISSTEIRDIASWAHHMLRLRYQEASPISSVETISKAVYDLTHPDITEKDDHIDFEDFCDAWKDAVDKLYGKRFENEHKLVLSELKNLNQTLDSQALNLPSRSLLDRIYLTQTEIDWVERALRALTNETAMPRYPLSRGPDKDRVINLLKWLTLWEVTKSSKSPVVQDKAEKIRSYLQLECENLLATCRR